MKTKAILNLLYAVLIISVLSAVTTYFTGIPFIIPFVVIYALAYTGGYYNHKHSANRSGIVADMDIQDTTYTGTYETGYFITNATFGLETIQKGLAWVKDGIKKKHNIGVLSFVDPLQERQSTPTQDPTKNLVVTGRVLDPQDCMTYQEINPRDFETHFEAEKLTNLLLARELPPTMANFMIQFVLNRAFEQIEVGIHMGSKNYTAPAGSTGNGQIKFFDGLIRKAIVDGGFVPVSSPAVLTTANIQVKMQDAYTKVPKAILSNPNRWKNLRYCMSVQDSLVYEDYLTTTNIYKNNDTTEAGIKRYKGIPVVALAGLPKDTFYLCEAVPSIDSNIWVGTNSTDDLQLMFRPLQNNSEIWFMKGLFKFDTNWRILSELVMHTTKSASDFTA